ncbi:MAG: hypothetical protein U0M21_00530 [Emergencia sp.]|nr:hypothetical protein [Emergencia sp.]
MIVKEYKTAKGVTIIFDDAAYRDKNEEEKAALRRNVDETISRILNNQLRKSP